MNWTNAGYHCPGYLGITAGPGYFKGAIERVGSYAYNLSGARIDDETNENLGLGPVVYWRIGPKQFVPSVSEAQLKEPSEMLAVADSKFVKSEGEGFPGSGDTLRCNIDNEGVRAEVAQQVRHGKNSNLLLCDGHVAAMPPSVLFNPSNTAAMWNYDHEVHPELWQR